MTRRLVMKSVFFGVVLIQAGAHGLAPSCAWLPSVARMSARGSAHTRPRVARLSGVFHMSADDIAANKAETGAAPAQVLYEEFSRYADKTSVAQEVIFEITSKEHFDDVVSRAAGADGHEGYHDAQGNWRIPHKLMMVEVHAGWCRVCKGLQPKLLKLVARHPEVLCCKINKTQNEELAGKLGVRGLPMLIFYKNGKRVDHHTTANINTIEEAIRDNT